jgi:hypothetical protein
MLLQQGDSIPKQVNVSLGKDGNVHLIFHIWFSLNSVEYVYIIYVYL